MDWRRRRTRCQAAGDFQSGRNRADNDLADASGYFGWEVKGGFWGYGLFVCLTFPATEGDWDAALVRPLEGTFDQNAIGVFSSARVLNVRNRQVEIELSVPIDQVVLRRRKMEKK
jgi:hypothetical protein